MFVTKKKLSTFISTKKEMKHGRIGKMSKVIYKYICVSKCTNTFKFFPTVTY